MRLVIQSELSVIERLSFTQRQSRQSFIERLSYIQG